MENIDGSTADKAYSCGYKQREKEILDAINLLIKSDYNSKEFMLFKSDLLEMITK